MTNEKTTEKKLSNQVLKYSAGESEGRERTTPKKRKRTRKDGAQPEKKKEKKRESDNQEIHLTMMNNASQATTYKTVNE